MANQEKSSGSLSSLLVKSSCSTPVSSRTKKGDLKQTEKTAISTDLIRIVNDESINGLKLQYDEITKNVKKIIEYNHASIWENMRVMQTIVQFGSVFKIFLHDAKAFYASIKKIEDSGEVNKIANTATLKATTHTVVHNWRELCNIFEIVQRDGIESLIVYIQNKFQIISETIRQIVTHDKKSCHKGKLESCGSNLSEILLALSNSIKMLLQQREMIHEQQYLIDASIVDIKSFIKVYNDAHYHQFTMSGFMQCQLGQFKANILSACNDIIVALKAAFSFDTDISAVIGKIEHITEQIQQIITIVELPPSFIKPATIAMKPPVVEPIVIQKKDPIAEVKAFTHDFQSTGSVGITKLESFISEMVKELGLEDLGANDVWSQIDTLKKIILDKMKEAKAQEIEHKLFIEKIRNQSKAITFLMKEKEELHKEKIDSEKSVLERNEDLEERNEELLRQVNEALTIAKRREEQLFQLRESDEESKVRQCLQRVFQRLNKLIDVHQQEFSFDKEDLITKVDKLSSFISEKKCLQCRERIICENEIVDKIDKLLGRHITSLPDSIDLLLKEHQLLTRKLLISEKNLDEKSQIINSMTTATNEIKRRTRELALRIGQPIGDNDNLAEITLLAFNAIDETHHQEIESLEKKLKNEHMKLITQICENLHFTGERNADTLNKNSLMLYEQFQDLKNHYEADEMIIKDVEEWLRNRSHVNTKGVERHEAVMMMTREVEQTPNPLTTPYNETQIELRKLRLDIETSVAKLAALLNRTNLGHASNMNNQRLLEVNRTLIDDLHDICEVNNQTIIKQNLILENTKNDLVQLCGTLWNNLAKPLQNLKDSSLHEIIIQLTDLLDLIINKNPSEQVSANLISSYFVPIQMILNTQNRDPCILTQKTVTILTEFYNLLVSMSSISDYLQCDDQSEGLTQVIYALRDVSKIAHHTVSKNALSAVSQLVNTAMSLSATCTLFADAFNNSNTSAVTGANL